MGWSFIHSYIQIQYPSIYTCTRLSWVPSFSFHASLFLLLPIACLVSIKIHIVCAFGLCLFLPSLSFFSYTHLQCYRHIIIQSLSITYMHVINSFAYTHLLPFSPVISLYHPPLLLIILCDPPLPINPHHCIEHIHV